MGTNTYQYDANGNMIQRVVGGQTFNLGYDAENRLVAVSGAATASFVYDGDGNRVKSTINGVTTSFVGNYYELTGSTATKYYYAGSQRIAMRVGTTDPNYLLTDHLGSTTVAADSSGNLVSELRYKPWGEIRSGTAPTRYTYTGQYSNVGDFGLMFYNARWYDPDLSRFTAADSVVPAGVQGYDRYAYVNNSPLNFTDPSGHRVACGVMKGDCEGDFALIAASKADRKIVDSLNSLHSCRSLACHTQLRESLFPGVSDWEISMLGNLSTAGAQGSDAAQYLYSHETEFDKLTAQLGTGAVWNWDGSISFPKTQPLPSADDPFVIGLVAHEAKHLQQRPFVALTAYGELEAWQVGINVTKAMGGTYGPVGERLRNLPLVHDRVVLAGAVLLMQEQQNGPSLIGPNYVAGWLLLLTTGF